MFASWPSGTVTNVDAACECDECDKGSIGKRRRVKPPLSAAPTPRGARDSEREAVHLVVAFGTRGDVLPLLAVACTLRSTRPVLFASHEAHRPLVQRLAPALTFLGSPTEPLSADASAEEEYAPVVAALSAPAAPRLATVLLNLFSLGAWHVAEAYGGAPCVVLSPCLVPYTAPSDFASTFRAEHPALHAALLAAPPGRVGWAEVEAWMWPLFGERWSHWRREALGLPKMGLRAHALPRATPLLYAYPAAVLPPPGYWPSSVAVIGFIAPPPPPPPPPSSSPIAPAMDAPTALAQAPTTAPVPVPTTAPAPVPARFESALCPGVDRAVLGTLGRGRPVYFVDRAVLGTYVDRAVLGTLVHGRPVYFGFGSCSSVLCASGLVPTTAPSTSGLVPMTALGASGLAPTTAPSASGLVPTTAPGASGLATLVVRAVVGATRELGCPLLLHTCHDDAALRCFLEVASEEEAPTTALRGLREVASEEEAAALEAMAQDAMARAAPSWAASHEAPSWAAPSGSSPQRIRIVHSDELPLHEVFTACRAVIHHAGAGRL